MLDKKLLSLFVVASLAGATAMCVPDRSAAPAAPDGPPLSAAQVAAVNARARLPHGRPDLVWVAELHTRAMQEWMRNRRQLASFSRQESCDRLLRVVRSFLPEVAQASRRPGPEVEAAFTRGIALAAGHAGCERPGAPLALWRAARSPLPAGQEPDSVVTGAYEAFVPMIETAVSAAASPDDVSAGVDGVLGQAAYLPAADFEVLAAVATLAASSAGYWYEYETVVNSGGEEPMSIFARVQPRFSWRLFGLADLGGGVSVVRAMRALGIVHPYLLVAGFFGGAAVGSGIYAHENDQ